MDLPFEAGPGDDEIRGGALTDFVRGAAGEDELYGDKAHDWLWGGPEDDLIAGEEGDDFLAARRSGHDPFRGRDLPQLVEPLARGAGHPKNRDADAEVRLKTKGLEKDTITEAEIARYDNGEHGLVKITIQIVRKADGTAKGQIFADGEELADLTKLISGSGERPDGYPRGLLWDTLTPIDAGTFVGYYRHSAKTGLGVELADWNSQARGVIKHDGIVRTEIQMHSGAHNGNSEGCFLFNRDFRAAFFEYLESRATQAREMGLDQKGAYYFPVVPVTVVLRDAQEAPHQTTIVPKDAPPVVMAGRDVRTKIVFDLDDGGVSHENKALDIFFTMGGSARFGDDFRFVNKVAGPPKTAAGEAHGSVWKVGDGVYGLRVGVDRASNMHSEVALDLLVLNDADKRQDTATFNVLEVDLLTYSSGMWRAYQRSTDPDTDGPNEVERLLLGNDRTAELTIHPSPPRVTALADDGYWG